MRQKLNLITIGVDDLQRSKDFYEKGLGWKPSGRSMEVMALYPLGNMVLALYDRQALAEDAGIEYQPSGFSGITLSHNTRSEQEVDEVINRVKSYGGTIVKPAQKVFWGGYGGYFKDPDGHLFEVAYNPFWELDEDGDLNL